MMKYSLLFLMIFFSTKLLAQSFDGCGEYIFKGILKADEKAPYKMSYIIYQDSKSQLTFYMGEKDDALKMALILNVPSTLKASITKKMDGTRGIMTFPYDISTRKPDPLSSKDTGIKKIKNFKCD